MNDWQRFFDLFAPRYDCEEFTRNTEAEVRFIRERLRPPPGGRILDVGCGTGRHSVGLARLGFRVTGVDLSGQMLALARQRAEEASVEVEWVHADATSFVRTDGFDAAICLCEGAMCLLGADDDPLQHDLTILHNVHSALRPRGRCLVNVLNGCRQLRAYNDDDIAVGRYDVLNMTEASDVLDYWPDITEGFQVRERGYTPPEIRRMFAWTGFRILGLYGGTAGAWNLQTPKLDEMELMIIAERPAAQ